MVFNQIIAPLLSTAIFMMGNGYLNTLISIKINNLGYSEFVVGLIASGFYVGLVLGALNIVHLIIKKGHLNSFFFIIALYALACLGHCISNNIVVWFILRFIAGISLGSFYVTIESWLLKYTENNNRGVILASYMVCLSAPQAFGQLLLRIWNIDSNIPFIIVAILMLLSSLPILVVNKTIVRNHDFELIKFKNLLKISALSMVVCFTSGLILSATYSLLPLYFDQDNLNHNNTAYFMFITLCGGMVLQYPIGVISDNFDRRKVIIVNCVVIMICVMLCLFCDQSKLSTTQLSMIFFVFGGMCFTLYPVALSLVCDSLKASHLVSVTQGFSLIEGTGSIMGPILAPPFINYFGPKGIYVYFALVIIVLLMFLISRIFKQKRFIRDNFIAAVQTSIAKKIPKLK